MDNIDIKTIFEIVTNVVTLVLLLGVRSVTSVISTLTASNKAKDEIINDLRTENESLKYQYHQANVENQRLQGENAVYKRLSDPVIE